MILLNYLTVHFMGSGAGEVLYMSFSQIFDTMKCYLGAHYVHQSSPYLANKSFHMESTTFISSLSQLSHHVHLVLLVMVWTLETRKLE
jgi:hypothetical protein